MILKFLTVVLVVVVSAPGAWAHQHEASSHRANDVRQVMALDAPLTLQPSLPRAGQNVTFTLQLSPKSIEESHGMLVHVIGVRRDLNEFFHTHAEPTPNGVFRAEHTFAQPGAYRVWLEARQQGMTHRTAYDVIVRPAQPTLWERVKSKLTVRLPSAQRQGQATSTVSQAVQDKFARLSQGGNSNCSAAFQGEIMKMSDTARLQGSCCTPMNLHRYSEQLEGLKQFAQIPEIPSDPYDIEVKLAKRLIKYYDLKLTAQEQIAYDYAMTNSHEKGPCCCKCWRWQVYGGLGKYLIRYRGFTGEQLTQVWNLSDGCGGEEGHNHS